MANPSGGLPFVHASCPAPVPKPSRSASAKIVSGIDTAASASLQSNGLPAGAEVRDVGGSAAPLHTEPACGTTAPSPSTSRKLYARLCQAPGSAGAQSPPAAA